MEYYDLDYGDENVPEYADYYDEEFSPDYMTDDNGGEYEEEPTVPSLTLKELYNYCIIPTINDSYSHLLSILTWSLLFLLSSRIIRLPHVTIHILSSVFGLTLLWKLFHKRIGWIACLWLTTYLNLVSAHYLLKKWRGPVCLITGVVYFVVCEIWLVEPIWWHAVRGVQMILLMKVVSLGYDVDFGSLKDLPGVFAVMGYIFNPGTVVFGPWISYEKYSNIFLPFKWSVRWIVLLVAKFSGSFVFFLVSTCFANWVIPDGSNKWLSAYRDALSFRASHYFVSYLSEVSSSLSGLDEVTVSKFTHLEVPRSLVDVVVNWNIPMHLWFKKYVFLPLKTKTSPFIAIFLTYGMSTLFHGLNFQLAAVLLSLGFYTYTEHGLRVKLSAILDACVAVRPCSECQHRRKCHSAVSIIVNVVFAALSVFHLAYLGMMFDSSKGAQEGGYSMVHTISKWQTLNFSSHYVIIFCYSLMSIL